MNTSNFTKILLGVFILVAMLLSAYFYTRSHVDLTTSPIAEVSTGVKNKEGGMNPSELTVAGKDGKNQVVNLVDDIAEFPKELLLTLPSGAEVLVNYKLDGSLNLPRPVRETFDTYIFDLIKLADSGTPDAASSVDALLGQCATVPRSRADHEQQLQHFLSTGKLGESNPTLQAFEVKIGSEAFNRVYQDLHLQHKLCSKITDQQLARKNEYRELAIERGEFKVLNEEALKSFDSDPNRFYCCGKRA
jgi:hypothetical protein